jgi:O-antigen chain-terminating methyltransferase
MNMEIKDQEKEVERIMEQIKENIEQKKALGVYSDEEIEWVKRTEGKIASSQDQGNHGFQEQLRQMNLHWDLKNKVPITSHRRILGSLLVLSKKTMRKLTKSYINLVLGEQVEFNSCAAKVINQLAAKLAGSEERYDNLAKRHQELFDKIDMWNAEVRQNHAQLRLEHNQLFDKVDQWNAELKRDHAHLTQHHQSLFDKVDQWNEDLRKEFAQLKDLHIALYQKYTAVQQENILLKRRLDIILSDLRKKTSLEPEFARNAIKHQERLLDHAYFLFEHTYRGLPEEIRERFKVYLPYLSGVSDILDVGCGRGEFLDLMRDHGIPAKGIDISDDMVYYCQERGLTVEQKEALDYLASLPDFSLGGIFAAQILEHLPASSLQEFIKRFNFSF